MSMLAKRQPGAGAGVVAMPSGEVGALLADTLAIDSQRLSVKRARKRLEEAQLVLDTGEWSELAETIERVHNEHLAMSEGHHNPTAGMKRRRLEAREREMLAEIGCADYVEVALLLDMLRRAPGDAEAHEADLTAARTELEAAERVLADLVAAHAGTTIDLREN